MLFTAMRDPAGADDASSIATSNDPNLTPVLSTQAEAKRQLKPIHATTEVVDNAGSKTASTLPARSSSSFADVRLHGFLDLLLDCFQIEARSLLHRGKFNRSLRQLSDLLLHELKSPELICEPVVERQ